jgi:hypothetical protein
MVGKMDASLGSQRVESKASKTDYQMADQMAYSMAVSTADEMADQ